MMKTLACERVTFLSYSSTESLPFCVLCDATAFVDNCLGNVTLAGLHIKRNIRQLYMSQTSSRQNNNQQRYPHKHKQQSSSIEVSNKPKRSGKASKEHAVRDAADYAQIILLAFKVRITFTTLFMSPPLYHSVPSKPPHHPLTHIP